MNCLELVVPGMGTSRAIDGPRTLDERRLVGGGFEQRGRNAGELLLRSVALQGEARLQLGIDDGKSLHLSGPAHEDIEARAQCAVGQRAQPDVGR